MLVGPLAAESGNLITCFWALISAAIPAISRSPMNASDPNAFPDYSRRHFLKTSALAVAGGISSNLIIGNSRGEGAASFTPNGDTLKIGLIGCGGRGTGAASNALTADKN